MMLESNGMFVFTMKFWVWPKTNLYHFNQLSKSKSNFYHPQITFHEKIDQIQV